MSTPADGKLANYLSSLWGYIQGAFTMVPPYFLGYSQLDTRVLPEWLELLLSDFGSNFQRGVGDRRSPALIANIYLRQGDGTGQDDGIRWGRIFDAWNEAIGNKSIPVYDYVGGNANSQVSVINVQGWPRPIPLGWENDLLIISTSVGLDFTETHVCE